MTWGGSQFTGTSRLGFVAAAAAIFATPAAATDILVTQVSTLLGNTTIGTYTPSPNAGFFSSSTGLYVNIHGVSNNVYVIVIGSLTAETIQEGPANSDVFAYDFNFLNAGSIVSAVATSSGITFANGYQAPVFRGSDLVFNINGTIFSAGATYNETVTLASAAPSVPEPATWMTAIAGFGMIGAAMRRRQHARISFAA